MKNISRRERLVLLALAVWVFGAVVYSSCRLFAGGILSWHIRQKEFVRMAAEVLLIFACLTLTFSFLRTTAKVLGALAVLSCFLWAHQVLVPVVISGLYLCYVTGMGGWVRSRLFGVRERDPSRDFLTGSLLVVCAFCLMSATGLGSMEKLWGFVLITAVLMAADFGRQASRVCIRKQEPGRRVSLWEAVAAAGVISIFCIQAGRMNGAVDFDSLWYGVRSPYILNNGRGIYENLGTIGVVYTYSKGWEVLTLPLSALPSYSFGISCNLWLAAGVLWLARDLGRCFLDRRTARWLPLFLAAIPGIMNMSITAKSDLSTLLFQLILFYETARYLEGERQGLWYGLAAFFFSWTLKPTALVFSTAVMGMSGVYLAATGQLFPKRTLGEKKGGLAVTALSLAALGAVWARTMALTGLPVTSVFSSLLTRAGFEMKYPFNVQKIPNSGGGLSGMQWIKNTVKRVYGILLDPQGEDMGHVILAWGSLAVWMLLGIWLAWFFLEKREDPEQRRKSRYLHTVFLPFLACNVLSLVLLVQVDGNYFMLFYVLLTVYVFHLMSRLETEQVKEKIRSLCVPVIVFSAVVMSLTNWSWTTGFTPVSWRHRGYYDHGKANQRELEDLGCGAIWEILARDPRSRLIAVGEHPKVLAFPCCAQSYLDITGSWGNVVLVKSMDNFVDFMRYAETDYVYTQAGYIAEEDRAWSLTCDLIEYGILTPVCYDHGNMLAEVDTEGRRTDRSVEARKEFEEQYRKKADSGVS